MIAVDTAVKRLLKEGIVPDMFATLDGMKTAELLNLTEQEEAAKEIPLLTKATCRQKALWITILVRNFLLMTGTVISFKCIK